MPDSLPVCEAGQSIKEAFNKMDAIQRNRCFVIDTNRKLLGEICTGDLRAHILKGGSDGERVMSLIKKEAPCIMDTDMHDEQHLTEKIRYLSKKNALTSQDFVAICNNQLEMLSAATLETLLQASSERHAVTALFQTTTPPKTICLIGGAGFLGSVLAHQLLDQGYHVKIFDRFVFGKESVRQLLGDHSTENRSALLDIYEGDMRSTSDLLKALDGADAVILLGAVVGDPASSKYPISTFEVNYLATQTVAEICAYLNINRLIFASTCSVYGFSKEDALLHEEAPLRPISHYARTKMQAERALLRIDSPNFAPTIMRMSTLYGSSYRMRYDLVVNTMMMHGVTNKKIIVFGGDQWRPLLSVGDAARAFIMVLQADIERVKRQVFNVGDERENYQIMSLGEMVTVFLKKKGYDIVLDVADNQTDARDYKVSFNKIQTALGFQSTDSVQKLLEELYQKTYTQFEKNQLSFAAHFNDQTAIQPDLHGITWNL